MGDLNYIMKVGIPVLLVRDEQTDCETSCRLVTNRLNCQTPKTKCNT